MKEYFLVIKSIDNLLINGEWQDVSLDAMREAARIDKLKKVDAYLTREDAELAALDGVDFDNDSDFYPILRAVIPNKLKGRATEVELEDGIVLNTRTFDAKNVTVTHAYLSHLDEDYDDVNLQEASKKKTAKPAAEESPKEFKEPTASAAVAVSRLGNLRRFVPTASLINAKNVLGLTAMGAAYYFGNTAVADLVAKTGYALPEVAAVHTALPVAAGIATRAATEAPELLMEAWVIGANVVRAAATGFANLCKAGKAKWDARKVPAKASVAHHAGSSRINQLAAVLEQPIDDFADIEPFTTCLPAPGIAISQSAPAKVTAFDNQVDNRAALRELIPQKQTASSEAAVIPTLH